MGPGRLKVKLELLTDEMVLACLQIHTYVFLAKILNQTGSQASGIFRVANLLYSMLGQQTNSDLHATVAWRPA